MISYVSATLFIPVQPAINAVEAGIYAREQLMYSGKLKAFTSLGSWYSEFRLYKARSARQDREGRRSPNGRNALFRHGWSQRTAKAATPGSASLRVPDYGRERAEMDALAEGE